MSTTDFKGKIGTTFSNSTPDWPEAPSSHDGTSPNVLVVLLDDTGFGNFGCYGSVIDTPYFDELAAGGLRYSNFHVTPLCSPTRASLLTGRNHHAVGMGSLANMHDIGFPSRRALVSRNAGTLAEILREEGYSTYALGKWHLNPAEHNSAAGPRHGWPLQRGFDRFYGFLPGATDQYYPELTHDNHPVFPPKTPDEGYHVTDDLVDHAIEYINDQKSIYPDTPFFMYFATGAMHEPHHAPKDYIDKYRGKFDAGWDVIREEYFRRQKELGVIPSDTVLPPRNPGVKPWDELEDKEKAFMCRLQETWAGFLEHTDRQVGRIVDHLKSIDQFDNTIIVLTADNGTSQGGGPTGVMYLGSGGGLSALNDGRAAIEARGRKLNEENMDEMAEVMDDIGGPKSFTDIPWGWSQVGNTPLRWYKQDTHGGGVRVPMIVHHPESIKNGGSVRNQFHHVSDITPTNLDMLDITPMDRYNGHAQLPITGTCFRYTYENPDQASQKGVQYFEMIGHRGIWHDGWKAVTRHAPGASYDDDVWELYNLAEDFSEMNNLAESEPERLRELIDLWWIEAGKNNVLPLADRTIQSGGSSPHPGAYHESLRYRFTPPISHIPSSLAPQIGRGNWQVDASIQISGDDSEGVIYSQGSVIDGFSLYIKDKQICFAHSALGKGMSVSSPFKLEPGPMQVSVRFEYAERGRGGTATIMVDGEPLESLTVPINRNAQKNGADIGKDILSPVTDKYSAPFAFTDVIHSVEVVIDPRK